MVLVHELEYFMQLLIGKGLFTMSCFMLSDVTCELIVGDGPRMVYVDGIKEVSFVDVSFFGTHDACRWYWGRFLFPCCLPHTFIFQKFRIVVWESKVKYMQRFSAGTKWTTCHETQQASDVQTTKSRMTPSRTQRKSWNAQNEATNCSRDWAERWLGTEFGGMHVLWYKKWSNAEHER